MIRNVDIAWLAELLEGEGSFVMSERSIAIVVKMTDRDVVERAAALLGGRSTVYRHTKGRVLRYSRHGIRHELRSPMLVYR